MKLYINPNPRPAAPTVEDKHVYNAFGKPISNPNHTRRRRTHLAGRSYVNQPLWKLDIPR